MPGKKWKRSLKRPKVYEAMRKHGFSKQKAARLSNWLAKRAKSRKKRKKSR